MNDDVRKYIIAGLKKNIRYDGRKTNEVRDLEVEVGILSTAEGSARVKIGETIVLAGVKMAIEKPFSDTPEDGNLMVNVELLPLSNPNFEPGPPSIVGIELARVIDRGIRESKVIDTKSLCVTPGEAVWSISVDVCPLNDAGNLFDAAALASIIALKSATYPTFADGKVDYKKKTTKTLKLQSVPISVTVLKIGDVLLVDPVSEEEEVYDARLTVAILENGQICALQKGGEKPTSVEELSKMIDLAQEAAKKYRNIF